MIAVGTDQRLEREFEGSARLHQIEVSDHFWVENTHYATDPSVDYDLCAPARQKTGIWGQERVVNVLDL